MILADKTLRTKHAVYHTDQIISDAEKVLSGDGSLKY